ncbi:uncharacterized protein LOC18435123 isoform X2 [Amborella trichopoda]|uniref:uncharacterized protein LOC18435123 isoform X2 n=1 Tax=Amborella trichopoda TaxID=13333 RepID=UPI0009BC99DB|nr:uncharacterized protein LOC18435123 isoform X2 [Amborella trichopoda]|eukprot:XP_020523426.1 uncharacterized protein LOC18435123 isoform X2 [Amborella trichopoda]
MVLGLRTKNRKGSTVNVDYVIHIQEIKPWPPSQSLKSLRSVTLQWENGERQSGSTKIVTPLTADGKIEFNESFRLPVSLCRDLSAKTETYQKNCLEMNLYEPRRDKTKGQLLGSAMVDLAEHGILKDAVSISVPMNCKRSFRNTAQPVVYIQIQPFERDSASFSSRDSLAKESSLDKDDGKESISTLMSEEYAEEAEIASFTDDDVSSHSSLPGSPSEAEARIQESGDTGDSRQGAEESPGEATKESREKVSMLPALPLESPAHNNSTPITKKPAAPEASSSSITPEGVNVEDGYNGDTKGADNNNIVVANEKEVALNGEVKETILHLTKEENNSYGVNSRIQFSDSKIQLGDKTPSFTDSTHSNSSFENDGQNGTEDVKVNKMVMEEHKKDNHPIGHYEYLEVDSEHSEDEQLANIPRKDVNLKIENSSHAMAESEEPIPEVKQLPKMSQGSFIKSTKTGNDLQSNNWGAPSNPRISTESQTQYKMTSVNHPHESSVCVSSETDDDNVEVEEVKEIDVLGDSPNDKILRNNKQRPNLHESSVNSHKAKYVSRERSSIFSDTKIQRLELKIEALEAELREAAATEVALYSIVAEHGSSSHKVHAPARRLSRLFIHACKHWPTYRRASTAKSIVSGLVLVAKACGNDVPRLTFWWSNYVVLRAIIAQGFGKSNFPKAAEHFNKLNDTDKGNDRKYSPLNWKENSPKNQAKKSGLTQLSDDWQDINTFKSALEKIESWIFSRIIESVWWQTLTPYMQPYNGEGLEGKFCLNLHRSFRRLPSLGDQQQGSFSINLWKKAFEDAFERLCPVRAGGHECGCLSVLAKLVMEQCVNRLDVAMFNAILRESEDEMPTDPVCDPIGDLKVLPIQAGNLSLGAGAKLKTAVGTWSRWLTDLFGIDADDSPADDDDLDDDRQDTSKALKTFHLLNALSDLLMLPKDILLDPSIRKEVCPTFGAPLIKRVLCNFGPDEFCPDPVPDDLLVALDSEHQNVQAAKPTAKLQP